MRERLTFFSFFLSFFMIQVVVQPIAELPVSRDRPKRLQHRRESAEPQPQAVCQRVGLAEEANPRHFKALEVVFQQFQLLNCNPKARSKAVMGTKRKNRKLLPIDQSLLKNRTIIQSKSCFCVYGRGNPIQVSCLIHFFC